MEACLDVPFTPTFTPRLFVHIPQRARRSSITTPVPLSPPTNPPQSEVVSTPIQVKRKQVDRWRCKRCGRVFYMEMNAHCHFFCPSSKVTVTVRSSYWYDKVRVRRRAATAKRKQKGKD